MQIYYRIVEVDDQESSMVVRYFTDDVDEMSLATSKDIDGEIILTPNGYPIRCRTDVNITVYDIDSNTQQVLEIIKSSAPAKWLELKGSITSNTILSSTVSGLINNVNSFEYIDVEEIEDY